MTDNTVFEEIALRHGLSLEGCPAGQTFLHAAAAANNPAALRELLDAGADIEAKDSQWTLPLTVAAAAGHADCVKVFVQRGADLDGKRGWGNQPLLMAAQSGHKECVELLLDGGADIEIKDRKGRTAIMRAAKEGFFVPARQPTLVTELRPR